MQLAKCRLLGAVCWMQFAGCSLLDADWILLLGFFLAGFCLLVLLAGFGLLDSNAESYFTGCCLLDAACWLSAACWVLLAGCYLLDAVGSACWMLPAGCLDNAHWISFAGCYSLGCCFWLLLQVY